MFRVFLSLLIATYSPVAFTKNGTQNFSIEKIKKQYPNAQIKLVTPEEYKTYERLYAKNSQPIKIEKAPQKKQAHKKNAHCLSYKEYNKSLSLYPKGHEGPRASKKSKPSWNFNSFPKGGGDKDFLVIVAVIGVVVVAALVVYSAQYLYYAATHNFQCEAWSDFGYRYTHIYDSNERQVRDGKMHGLYYSFGYQLPFGVMGLTTEFGTHDLTAQIQQQTQPMTTRGAYLLLGPTFTLPFSHYGGHAFQIELLAGTSNQSEIGLMSTLRFGLSFRTHQNMTLGLNFGAALIDIKDYDSYLSNEDDLNFLTGFGTSIRW